MKEWAVVGHPVEMEEIVIVHPSIVDVFLGENTTEPSDEWAVAPIDIED